MISCGASNARNGLHVIAPSVPRVMFDMIVRSWSNASRSSSQQKRKREIRATNEPMPQTYLVMARFTHSGIIVDRFKQRSE